MPLKMKLRSPRWHFMSVKSISVVSNLHRACTGDRRKIGFSGTTLDKWTEKTGQGNKKMEERAGWAEFTFDNI